MLNSGCKILQTLLPGNCWKELSSALSSQRGAGMRDPQITALIWGLEGGGMFLPSILLGSHPYPINLYSRVFFWGWCWGQWVEVVDVWMEFFEFWWSRETYIHFLQVTSLFLFFGTTVLMRVETAYPELESLPQKAEMVKKMFGLGLLETAFLAMS